MWLNENQRPAIMSFTGHESCMLNYKYAKNLHT